MKPGRTAYGRPRGGRRALVGAAVLIAIGIGVGVVLGRILPDGEFVPAPIFLLTVFVATSLGGLRAGLAAALAVGVARWAAVGHDAVIAFEGPVLPAVYLSAGGVVAALVTDRLERSRRRAQLAADRLSRLSEFGADLAEVDDLAAAPDRIAALIARATGASDVTLLPAAVAPKAATAGSIRASGRVRLALRARHGGDWVLELTTDARMTDRDEVRFVGDVARQAGQTLERLALRESDRRARASEQFIAEASTRLAQSLDTEEIIEALRSLLVPILADECVVVTGDAPEPPSSVVDGTPGADNWRETLRLELRSRDRRVGWLRLGRAQRPFDEHDRIVVHRIASRIAQALDNAGVYDAQARISTTLERSLLPYALLPVEGVDLAGRYFPGTKGSDVGGDFYDAVRRPDGSLVLIIGDVQGKGVEAATLTAVARHTLRSSALEGSHPAEMLGRLNQALFYGQAEQAVAHNEEDPRFVTAAVVALTPFDGGFRAAAACAGHPPPLVVRADTSTEYLPARGALLGLFDDPVFKESDTELREADTIVLYTDGVTELRHGGEWFDDVGLGRLLHNRRATVDAEAIAQLIEDTVLLPSGGTARDDIALLVASVRGPERRLEMHS